jgi:hypothetical protein
MACREASKPPIGEGRFQFLAGEWEMAEPFDLRGSGVLVETVEVASGEALAVAPLHVALDRRHIYVLWKAAGFYSASSIRAPPAPPVASSSVDVVTSTVSQRPGVPASPGGLGLISFACPTVVFIVSGREGAGVVLTLEDVVMGVAPNEGQITAQRMVMVEGGEGAGGKGSLRRRRDEEGSPDVTVSWRLAGPAGASDVTLQLAPCSLGLTARVMRLMDEIAGFKSVGPRRPLSAINGVRRLAGGGARPPAASQSVKLLCDNCEVTLLGPVGDGVAASTPELALVFELGQVVLCQRASAATLERYANLVGLTARLESPSCRVSPPPDPLFQRTNVFVSTEEAAVGGGPLIGSVNFDGLVLHLSPSRVAEALAVIQAYLPPPSRPIPARVPSREEAAGEEAEAWPLTVTALSDLSLHVSDRVPPELGAGVVAAAAAPPRAGQVEVVLLHWAFARPTRIRSLSLPQPLLVAGVGFLPIGTPLGLELSGRAEGGQPEAWGAVCLAEDVGLVGGPPGSSSKVLRAWPCDEGRASKVWRLSATWDPEVLPLDQPRFHRALIMALVSCLRLETYVVPGDQATWALQLAVPTAEVRHLSLVTW